MNKTKAKRNRTLIFTEKEKNIFSKKLITLSRKVEVTEIINKTINQDLFYFL